VPVSANTMPFGSGALRRWIPLLSISLPLLGWLIFSFGPSAATIFYSLTQYSGEPGTPLNFSGLHNYVQAFSTLLPELRSTIVVTLKFTIGVTVIQNVIGLLLALLLNRRLRAFAVYRAFVFLPQVLSVAVVASMFLLIFNPLTGPAEVIYHWVTGSSSSFFGSSRQALALVVLVNVWMYAGFTMMVYIAGFRNIPGDVYEAAAVDGCGRWRTFTGITWPLLAPATTVNVWLAAMGTLGQFQLILALTGGAENTQTIGMYMYSTAFGTSSQLGYGSMIAVLQFFLTLILGGLLLFLLRRREVQL